MLRENYLTTCVSREVVVMLRAKTVGMRMEKQEGVLNLKLFCSYRKEGSCQRMLVNLQSQKTGLLNELEVRASTYVAGTEYN